MNQKYKLGPQDTPFHRFKCLFFRKVSLVTQVVMGKGSFNCNKLMINPLTIPCRHLDTEFSGYRIAQISDIHIGTQMSFNRLHEIITLVNKEIPDLIVITGDLISDFNTHLFESLASSLRMLKPRDAVLAVRGNHDCWIDNSRFYNILEQNGIIDISNSVYTIYRGKTNLHIAGVDDIRYKMDCLDHVLNILPLEGAAILLAHEPDFADISAHTGRFDIQLSGHSHGGQIIFPLIGSPFLPPLGRKYPSGMYKINHMVQYTNRGIGTASIPFRYHCPAEISIITLEMQ